MVAKTTLSPSLVMDQDNESSLERRRRHCGGGTTTTDTNGGIRKPMLDESGDETGTTTSFQSLSRKDSFSTNGGGGISASLSASFVQPVLPKRSASRVRCRLLTRLGFSPPPEQHSTRSSAAAGSPKSVASLHMERRRRKRSFDSPVSKHASFEISLNDANKNISGGSILTVPPQGRPFHLVPQSSSLSSMTSGTEEDTIVSSLSSSPTANHKAVSFHSAVTVHPIPKHTSYSNRIRETIWTNPMEMQESAARNCLEFAAENWDWRQVAEDHDMVPYQGERVHPIHFCHEYNIRRQFCAVMSAQQQSQCVWSSR